MEPKISQSTRNKRLPLIRGKNFGLNHSASLLDTLQCTAWNQVTESARVRGVNAYQPRSDVCVCQPSKQKEFGILNASVENGFASVDIGLRFGLGDQIAAVLNQDETFSRGRTGIRLAIDWQRRCYAIPGGRSVR
jgi:hypothetical protein